MKHSEKIIIPTKRHQNIFLQNRFSQSATPHMFRTIDELVTRTPPLYPYWKVTKHVMLTHMLTGWSCWKSGDTFVDWGNLTTKTTPFKKHHPHAPYPPDNEVMPEALYNTRNISYWHKKRWSTCIFLTKYVFILLFVAIDPILNSYIHGNTCTMLLQCYNTNT